MPGRGRGAVGLVLVAVLVWGVSGALAQVGEPYQAPSQADSLAAAADTTGRFWQCDAEPSLFGVLAPGGAAKTRPILGALVLLEGFEIIRISEEVLQALVE